MPSLPQFTIRYCPTNARCLSVYLILRLLLPTYLQSTTAFTQDEHTRSHNRQTATSVCNVSCCFMDWKWGDAQWLRSWYDTNKIINCERITPNPCSRSECCKICAYMYAVQLLRYIVFDLVNSSLTSLTNELSNLFDRHQLAQWHSTRDNVDTTT